MIAIFLGLSASAQGALLQRCNTTPDPITSCLTVFPASRWRAAAAVQHDTRSHTTCMSECPSCLPPAQAS